MRVSRAQALTRPEDARPPLSREPFTGETRRTMMRALLDKHEQQQQRRIPRLLQFLCARFAR